MTSRTFANPVVVGFLEPASPKFGLSWMAGSKAAKLAVVLEPACRFNVTLRSVDLRASN